MPLKRVHVSTGRILNLLAAVPGDRCYCEILEPQKRSLVFPINLSAFAHSVCSFQHNLSPLKVATLEDMAIIVVADVFALIICNAI